DAAGNDSPEAAITAPDITAPDAPTVTLANDTGDVDGITSDGTINVGDLIADGSWEYSTDGGDTWTVGEGESFELPEGAYADGDVVARQTDAAGNTSDNGLLGAVEVVDLEAVDDIASVDLGEPTVVVNPSTTEEGVQVLDIVEGDGGTVSGTTFTVSDDQLGNVSIQVQQVALLAVADAFRVEVYDEEDNLVYVGATENSLVGDIGGLEILGLTGDDELVANISGLAAGSYTVVVRNDQSTLEGLLDGLTLEELGEAGVVLGPENQAIVLDDVENALNGQSALLGTTVRGILEPILNTSTTIGAGELVGILTEPLDGLGLTQFLDDVIDALAEALLSNTLTAFQFTDITTTLTEYSFDGDLVATGNVITGDEQGAGEDAVIPGSAITLVTNSLGQSVEVPDTGVVSLEGLYGVLEIAADGSYTYTANGDNASIDQEEVFTYTISDGINSAEADLTINIEGSELPLLTPQDDSIELDLGAQSASVNTPVSNSNVGVGLLEGDAGDITGVPLMVTQDQVGEVRIEVSQTALLAVADAYVVEVVDAEGNVVFTAATPDNPIVGDVLGLGVLGVTGDGTLVTTAPGLAPGDYTVVVRNDQSAVAEVISGLSLAELGDKGVILGPENQGLVLDAVDNALGDNPLSGSVRGVLELTLDTLNGLGASSLVDVISSTLTTLGLSSLVEDVLDAVASSLASNTLTLLQTTNITTTLTEYNFEGDLAASGNVLTGEGEGNVADGIANGGVVTAVTNSDGESVTVLGTGSEGVQIAGLYGVLTLFENGSYTYAATGARDGLGQEEVFTYNVTNGAFAADGSRITAQATLTVGIDGEGVASDVALAGVEYDYATEAGVDFDNDLGFSWLLGALGATVWTRQEPIGSTITVAENTTQDLTIAVTGGDLLGVGGNTSISIEKLIDGAWQVQETYDSNQLVGLLGVGGSSEFVVGDLTPGQYRVSMEPGSGLVSVAGSISVDLSSTVTQLDEFEQAGISVAEGNLFENDILRSEDFELSVGGQSTSVGSDVTLVGQYGTLTVAANGDYTYTPDAGLDYFTTVLEETFTYEVDYGDRVEQADLTVFVSPSGAGIDSDTEASILTTFMADDVIALDDGSSDEQDSNADFAQHDSVEETEAVDLALEDVIDMSEQEEIVFPETESDNNDMESEADERTESVYTPAEAELIAPTNDPLDEWDQSTTVVY
ncbi:beta strand repeat-containing protein, partial [Halomonas sp. AOP27-A1-41]|uniref:beta strand repeat-containing protein n=1 Tax=Halomonas sp. AOP27-A1-41 TaxID=3457707 RepID=UPI004034D8E7